METQRPRHLSSERSVTQPHPAASQITSRPEDRRDSTAWPRASPRGVCGQAQAWRRPACGCLAALARCWFASRAFVRISQEPLPLRVSPFYRRGTEAQRTEGACSRAACAPMATELGQEPRRLTSVRCSFRFGSSGASSIHTDSHTKKVSLSRGPCAPSTLDLLRCHHSHQPPFESWIPSIHKPALWL